LGFTVRAAFVPGLVITERRLLPVQEIQLCGVPAGVVIDLAGIVIAVSGYLLDKFGSG